MIKYRKQISNSKIFYIIYYFRLSLIFYIINTICDNNILAAQRRFATPENMSCDDTEGGCKETNNRRYVCSKCDYGAMYLSAIKRHELTHTYARPCHDGKPVYNCEHCNYSSVSKQNLGRHVRIHTGERPYKCAECGFTAARKWTLVTHLRNHHKDNSPCPCTEWDYAAGIPYRISHNRNCPYKCKKCDFVATQLSDLHLHQQTHMKVQRIYNCDKCDYVTAKKSNMSDHLRTHSGERPYKCAECGYAAAKKWTLASHFKANHTNKLTQVSASE